MRAEGIERTPRRVVISGGIGSGKSTVVGLMRELGAVVIESDVIGHEVLEPDGPAYEAVSDRWPMVVVNGRVDRGLLAAIVFTDSDQLAELEELTHPHIAAEIKRQVAAAADRDVVVELPLMLDLAGAGWTRVVVDAPNGSRLERAVDRGMDQQDVANRMASQPDRTHWREGAAFVLDNAGSLEELEVAVKLLWNRL